LSAAGASLADGASGARAPGARSPGGLGKRGRMTSEVVLMNRQAVAMAADSAVTISGPQYLKTYQSVDKLFPLVDGQPVAVMIYNNAEIMSTPWETVISLYREAVRGKPLDTLEAYAEDFMS